MEKITQIEKMLQGMSQKAGLYWLSDLIIHGDITESQAGRIVVDLWG